MKYFCYTKKEVKQLKSKYSSNNIVVKENNKMIFIEGKLVKYIVIVEEN